MVIAMPEWPKISMTTRGLWPGRGGRKRRSAGGHANSFGHTAMNIGVAKGSTFERVLVIPTQPMLRYLRSGDLSHINSPYKLYIAVTRAMHSVAFAVPGRDANFAF